MREPLFSRWYVPIAFGATAMVALIVMVVAAAQMVTVETPDSAPLVESNAHLRIADDELDRGNVAASELHLRAAYAAAARLPGWESLLDVGDGFRRLALATGASPDSVTQARAAYLAALVRARHGRSVDGVLRAGEGFGALGDYEVVRQSIVMARRIADRGGDAVAHGRVRAFTERWSTRAHTNREEIVQ
ncbi:MAG TPA: hypothetical protein VGL09_14275 [Methylomirabilota bacterium]